jgi:hypothetical protein
MICVSGSSPVHIVESSNCCLTGCLHLDQVFRLVGGFLDGSKRAKNSGILA